MYRAKSEHVIINKKEQQLAALNRLVLSCAI